MDPAITLPNRALKSTNRAGVALDFRNGYLVSKTRRNGMQLCTTSSVVLKPCLRRTTPHSC